MPDLSAVSGLHHVTIRAMIQRAIGPGLTDGSNQPELPIFTDLAGPLPPEPKRDNHVQPMPPSTPTANRPRPVMSL
jgi:hypothetical protein